MDLPGSLLHDIMQEFNAANIPEGSESDYATNDSTETLPISRAEAAQISQEYEAQKAVAEDRREGVVSRKTMLSYFRLGGKYFLGISIAAQILLIVSSTALKIFVEIWTSDTLHTDTWTYLQ
eukprot:jgi/Hompol1/2456/HPOL_006035-RA